MDAPTTYIVNTLAQHFGFDSKEALQRVAEAMAPKTKTKTEEKIQEKLEETKTEIKEIKKPVMEKKKTAEEKKHLFDMIAGQQRTNRMKNKEFNRVHRVDIPADIEAYDLTQFITEMAKYFMPIYSDKIKQRVLQDLADTDWSDEFYKEQYGTPYRFLKTEAWNNALSGASGIMSKLEQGRKRMVQAHITQFRDHMRRLIKDPA